MDNKQLIKIKNKLNLQKSASDSTLDISKTELERRFEVNINDILNGFKNVPSFIEAKKSLEKDSIYKVIVPKDITKKLADGSAQWNFDKSGMQLPMIKDQKGNFICQARLEQSTPANFENINNLALHSTMANVLEQLEEINEQVSNILQGQLSDRIGSLKGAEETYRQALLSRDQEFKKHLLSQSITEFNRGRSQLIESLKNTTKFIDNLPNSDFMQFFYSLINKVNTDKIEKQFLETQHIFENIISSSYYLALAYEELGEPLSLKESLIPLKDCLKEYSQKIAMVSEFLPYDPKLENESSWYKNPERIIEQIDSDFSHILSKDVKYIEIDVSGNQLINVMED